MPLFTGIPGAPVKESDLVYEQGEYNNRSQKAHYFSRNFGSVLICACGVQGFGFTILLLFFLDNDSLFLAQKSATCVLQGTSIL